MRQPGVATLMLVIAIGAASAGDFDTLRVGETIQFDKAMAGPADSGILLSPDGGKAMHLGLGGDACLYDLTGPSPKELNCWTFPERPMSPEDMAWSPDGTRILWPTFGAAFIRFHDTDIQILDPADPTAFVNLTDDLFVGSAFKSGPGNFDVSARWLDADTIMFARYTYGRDGMKSRDPGVLLSVETNGVPGLLLEQAPGSGFVMSLAATADGSKVAFLSDDRNNADASGIYVIDRATNVAEKLAPMTAFGEDDPFSVTYSADGRYLLVLGRDKDGHPVPHVVEMASGAITRIAEGFQVLGAAWSPTGSALIYLTTDPGDRKAPTHLNLAEPPTAPGRLLDVGPFMPPVCCGLYPIVWARNDTMALGNREEMDKPFLIRFQR